VYNAFYSDGVGRTGAFIATHAEMERMKAETVVDLFQFIKGMRIQRAGMVSSEVRFLCLGVARIFI
jgi:protein tyrosine phosphatase